MLPRLIAIASLPFAVSTTPAPRPASPVAKTSLRQVDTQQVTVEIQLNIVQFDRALDRRKLPFDLKEVAEHIARQPGEFSPRFSQGGRIPAVGLARQMRVERLTVEDNGHVLRYSNGALTTQSTEAATDASRKPPWQIVAAPRLRVAVGQDAQMTIGQPISYLEKRDDGCLELRQEPGQVEGVNLSLKVERAAEKEIRFQPIELKFSRVAGRQPVPDVPLDVGRPIIDSRETSLGCTLDRGNVAVIPLPQNDEDAPILVFLTAEVVAGDDQD